MFRSGILGLLALALTGPISGVGESGHARIDREIETAFPRWKINAPAAQCDDAEFLRRASLDLTGKIPDATVAARFFQDRDPDKRARLIDHLLASDDFARHLATVFDVMLMERRPDTNVTTAEWRDYLTGSFAKNKPLDQLAREILGADGVDPQLRPAAKYYLDRAVEADTLVRDTGRLFLGVDLQCAQCHDHPTIDGWKHRHFFGLSVFFSGSKTFKNPDGKLVLQEMVTAREVEFASVFKPNEPSKTGPRLLDGPALPVPEFPKGQEYVETPSGKVRAVPKFSLRQLLAEQLPSRETPAFTRNLANRLWAHLMGRGLVHPLDAHHAENPPSHPALLDWLGGQLIESGYDTRAFLREIMLSAAYQRSSLAPEGVDPDSLPAESFAIANLKGLSPEQLFQSLLIATQSGPLFEEQIETALREDAPAYAELEKDAAALQKARDGERARRIGEFVTTFASTPGQPEVDFQASLPQALFLANHPLVAEWLEPRSGNLAHQMLIRDEPDLVAEEIYLSVLSRAPSANERAAAAAHLATRGPERPAALKELIWSLLASAEFRLNH
jgi:hypothetical protein